MAASTSHKLHILADAAKYDASCASSGGKRKRPEGGIGNAEGMGICHSYTPDGRCVSLLKILLTNYCIYDCLFCVNRISSDTPRARFTVSEVVNLTLEFYKRNYIEGLFLSSGIIQNADYTMEQLVRVAKSLRFEHKFGGYIHLKTIPNASAELIAEAGRWADRLSMNIELPVQSDLDRLAPAKQHSVIERGMKQIHDAGLRDRRTTRTPQPSFARAGQSTQLIVGATSSSDSDILAISSRLYKSYKLKRVYYSAFSPIPHSAPGLPVETPPLIREHRLYQADWLVRFYGFRHEEILGAEQPNLDLVLDPKVMWALRNRHLFPVDINRASRALLLKVPGLGVRTVNRIIGARRFASLRIADLLRLRVPISRAQYFISALDTNPELSQLDSEHLRTTLLASVKARSNTHRQLSLFEDFTSPSPHPDFNERRQASESAITGEL